MDILPYFWAENYIAQGVIFFLFALFVLWLILLIRSWWRLRAWLNDIEHAQDVSVLKDLKTKVHSEEAEPNADFVKAIKALGLRYGSPIRAHLKALYRAGLEGRRLDVSELIAHTSNVALRELSLLRAGLGSFIVIGLLGTLLGLAESLAFLGTVLNEGIDQASVRGGLAELLGGLQSAFAPSILGVFLTILGVIAFGIYVWRPVTEFRSRLEWATLTKWVPLLYPTTSQRLEEQVHRNFEAAERVAEFAEQLEGKFTDFEEELGGTSESLRAFRQTTGEAERVAKELGRASERFATAAESVSDYQKEVNTQFEHLEARSQRFEEKVRSVLGEVAEAQTDLRQFFREDLHPLLSGQSERLYEVLQALQAYETAYLDERENVEGRLQTLLAEVQSAYAAIGQSNEELVEQVGDPLREDLREGLVEVTTQLQDGLDNVHQKLSRLDAPLTTTTERIGRVVETMDSRMQALLREVQQEFARQNHEVQQRTKAMSDLEAQIAELLSSLDGASKRQEGAVGDLAKQIDSLGSGMEALANALAGHARSAKALENTVKKHSGYQSDHNRRWWSRIMFWRPNNRH